MLKFHREIIKDFDGDGLLVLGRGLGLDKIISFFVEIHSNPKNLVILLNSSDSQFKRIREENEVEEINAETNSRKRKELYLKGGVLRLTARIMIVDMLNNILPSELVNGILVINAEQIQETNQLAFVLKYLRSKNQKSFIKAFSNEPQQFVTQILTLERKLKALQLREIKIWPRFHKLIIEDINSNGSIELIEIRIPLTKKMISIQQSLLDLISQILQELKRLYPQV
jgi:DNA excision repair protein ERCC-4